MVVAVRMVAAVLGFVAIHLAVNLFAEAVLISRPPIECNLVIVVVTIVVDQRNPWIEKLATYHRYR